MIHCPPYRPVLYLLLVALLYGCAGKQLNTRITLWRNDKIPYGSWYAYHHLPYIFTDATIETSDRSPTTFYGYENDNDDGAAAYIIMGLTVKPDEKEWNAILNHAIAGNHVFISAWNIGKNILDSFDLEISDNDYVMGDSMSVTIRDHRSRDDRMFTYPGFRVARHFTGMDSAVTNVLGWDKDRNANFVRFNYENGGAVYIHLAPAAFTNFFLLHRQNKEYYDLAMSAIPDSVNEVRWDDYFRHHIDGNNSSNSAFSKLKAFLGQEVLRWAFWLTILLFAIVYLVESKRKQRAIPSVRKPQNSSLDFVRTVGRLYYQRKDNKNLAQKISAHFLGHVRTRYNMHTSQTNDDFDARLAYKSGYPLTLVKEIMDQVRSFDTAYEVSDDELMTFNDKIDKFINKP